MLLGGVIEEIKAGDGARTRDRLLGRQGVPESPLVWYRSAVGADRTGASVFYAVLTKDVAFPWHKMLRTFLDIGIYFGQKMLRTS